MIYCTSDIILAPEELVRPDMPLMQPDTSKFDQKASMCRHIY